MGAGGVAGARNGSAYMGHTGGERVGVWFMRLGRMTSDGGQNGVRDECGRI